MDEIRREGEGKKGLGVRDEIRERTSQQQQQHSLPLMIQY
jgi:hypothetical protein